MSKMTYDLTAEDVLVDLYCLVVDDVEVGVEALGESLRQLFFHRHRLIWIPIDRAFELLQTSHLELLFQEVEYFAVCDFVIYLNKIF